MQQLSLSLALSAALSFSVFANDDFQLEVGAGVAQFDELDVYELGATYFFAPVDTSKGPLAEANFLNRQSSVSAVYQRFDFPGGEDTNGFVAGEYVFDTGAFVNALVSDDSFNAIGGGFYYSDTWMFDASVNMDDDFDYISTRIGTKKLLSLAGDNYLALNADYMLVDEGDNVYSLGAEYYLSRSFSVGLGIDWFDQVTDLDDRAIDVTSTWFVTSNVSLNAGVRFIDTNEQSDELYQLAVTARF